jgi:hypothetical protein
MRAARHTNPILHNFIILVIYSEDYKLWSFQLFNSLRLFLSRPLRSNNSVQHRVWNIYVEKPNFTPIKANGYNHGVLHFDY